VVEYQGSVIREGLNFGEGPRWRDGRLWYSDLFDQAVHAFAPGGADERVLEVTARPSGLGWMPDGSLLIVSMLDRRVLRLGLDGSVGEHADLAPWASAPCNDMVVDAAGRAYVGNFGFDLWALWAGEPVEARSAELLRVDPDGQVSVAAEDLRFPNGTVITADGRTLIVAESGGRRLTAFDISADGGLSNRRVWADLAPHEIGPDGICLDASGAVWVANAAGPTAVRVAEGGEVLDTVRFSQTCYACMLGGPDGRELFAVTAPTAVPAEASASAGGRIESARVDVGHAGLP
jgi:sugar lactone lactonase YvrE